MDPDRLAELVAQIGTDTPPTTEDLHTARDELAAALHEAAAADTPDLEAARSLRATIDAIDTELAERATRAETERAEMAQLLDGLDPDPDPEPEADDEADAPAPEATADPVESPEPVEQAAPEQESVAASVPLRDVLRRRRAHQATEPETPEPVGAFRGIGNASSQGVLHSMRDVAETFARFARDTSVRTTLVRAEYEHPRSLTPDAAANMEIVNAAVGPVVAAGGICPPIGARFDQTVCGDRGRPIRDSLPSFGPGFGGRGGVAFPPPLVFGDLAGAVSVWDEATDAAPGSTTKPCIRVECGPETTVLVDAITACVTIGNFQARFNTEQWNAALQLLAVEHDALAELTLFTALAAASDPAAAVVIPAIDETARNTFVGLAKAAARYRSARRLRRTTTLRFVTSEWLLDAIRAALTRQQPGDQAFQVADSIIAGYFAALNISPVYSPDVNRLAAQTDATLDDFPATATGVLYPEGSVLFLDGGTLDLGTEITDSTLNSTNDRQAFMETFEALGVVGCSPIELTIPITEGCVCGA